MARIDLLERWPRSSLPAASFDFRRRLPSPEQIKVRFFSRARCLLVNAPPARIESDARFPLSMGRLFFLCIHLQSARSLLLHSPLYLLVVDRFSVRSVHPSSQLMSAYSPTLFGYEKACGVWRRRQRRKSGTIIRPRRWCISRREIRTSFFFNLALSKRLEGAGDSRESDSRRHIICQGRGETYFFPLESHKSLVFL